MAEEGYLSFLFYNEILFDYSRWDAEDDGGVQEV
jgi:hypothetical protein